MLNNNVSAAFGALRSGFLNIFYYVLTFGISRAGDEFSVSADLNDHFSAAFIADDICFVFLKLKLYAVHFGFGFFKGVFKIAVEFTEKLVPLNVAAFNAVKLIFHLSGKFYVNDFRETLLHQLGNNLSKLGGNKTFCLSLYIFPACKRRNCSGIG